VVGDHDAVETVVDGFQNVFLRVDALEPDLHLCVCTEPGDGAVPFESWVCGRLLAEEFAGEDRGRHTELGLLIVTAEFFLAGREQVWKSNVIWECESIPHLVQSSSEHGDIDGDEKCFVAGSCVSQSVVVI